LLALQQCFDLCALTHISIFFRAAKIQLIM
jgi:hypothetical protein